MIQYFYQIIINYYKLISTYKCVKYRCFIIQLTIGLTQLMNKYVYKNKLSVSNVLTDKRFKYMEKFKQEISTNFNQFQRRGKVE